MPFDGIDATPALNRARLIEALRDVPPKHMWNFGTVYREPDALRHECHTTGCAIGLGKVIGLWDQVDGTLRNIIQQTVAPRLGQDFLSLMPVLCPKIDAYTSRITEGPFIERRYGDVTAAMVADALEAAEAI